MIQKFINLFRGKLAQLGCKSNNILNVFTKTLNDLEKVNTEILKHDIEVAIEEAKLVAKRCALKELHDKNDAMKKKFEEFFK